MRRARFTSVIAAGGAMLAAGPLSAQQRPPVHVATIPIDNGAEAYYALDQGMFAKAGLDVDIRSMNSGPAIVAAVASGAAMSDNPGAKYEKIAPERLALLGKNRALYTSRPLSPQSLASVVDFSAKHGVIDKAFPPENLIAASTR